MKKIIPIILIVALVGGVMWRIAHRGEFLYAGTVEATEVDISPQVATVIAAVEASEGRTAKKGDVLVTLTGDDFKLAADNAEREFKRAESLHKSGAMPDETYDRLRFKRDDAALRVAWCTIRSPLDGTVIRRYHEPGELVNPSMKLLTLADLSEVWAYVYVPQSMLARLALNMPVKGTLPELNMREIDGRVVFIRSEAEFTPKNVQTRDERQRLVYGVKMAFPNKDGVLKPGMTIEVKLPDSK
jgi:HlyD family secretion protein